MPKTEVMVRVLYPTAFPEGTEAGAEVGLDADTADGLVAAGYAERLPEPKPTARKRTEAK